MDYNEICRQTDPTKSDIILQNNSFLQLRRCKHLSICLIYIYIYVCVCVCVCVLVCACVWIVSDIRRASERKMFFKSLYLFITSQNLSLSLSLFLSFSLSLSLSPNIYIYIYITDRYMKEHTVILMKNIDR